MASLSFELDNQIIRTIVIDSRNLRSKKDRDFLKNWLVERIKLYKREKSFLTSKKMMKRYNAAINGLRYAYEKLQ